MTRLPVTRLALCMTEAYEVRVRDAHSARHAHIRAHDGNSLLD